MTVALVFHLQNFKGFNTGFWQESAKKGKQLPAQTSKSDMKLQKLLKPSDKQFCHLLGSPWDEYKDFKDQWKRSEAPKWMTALRKGDEDASLQKLLAAGSGVPEQYYHTAWMDTYVSGSVSIKNLGI